MASNATSNWFDTGSLLQRSTKRAVLFFVLTFASSFLPSVHNLHPGELSWTDRLLFSAGSALLLTLIVGIRDRRSRN